MITELLNGWVNYILGSAIILLIYSISSLLWDVHKYKTIIKRLDDIEKKISHNNERAKQ